MLCAVMCDEEFESNVATDTRTVNVDQYRFLNCSKKQMLDEDSTQRPSNALSNATGGCFVLCFCRSEKILT